MDWLILKTFLTLFLIIGLMFGILLIVRKYFYRKPQFVDESFKILASLPISQKDPFGHSKKAIYVIKVFNKAVMVGISENAIASLGEISDPDIIQRLESASSSRERKSFADVLKGITLR
jgi:flagellar biogenesis protein FliO